MKRRLWISLLAVVAIVAAVLLIQDWLEFNTGATVDAAPSAVPPTAQQLARGEYLARAGNCIHCHTAQGGEPLAGGRGIDTPFGTVFTTNLTPDRATGLGEWSANDFWRALHHGRSRDGRRLLPAFPFTNFTQITRADSDALFAWLQARAPVAQSNATHTLRWPYDTQMAQWVWRKLYFSPSAFQPDSSQTDAWNRGAYLVQVLGHCSACHAARSGLGGSADNASLAGGLIPQQNWYAPSLADPREAGLQQWSIADIARLLKTGSAANSQVSGPMAEVVLHSTQYLTDSDITAMATYLKGLPVSATRQALALAASSNERPAQPDGAEVYAKACAQCHGAKGEGVAGAYPALAGNRAVTLPSSVNLVQIVLKGGFAPATQGNPRPFGMPPFSLQLNDAQVASVLTYIRSAWGNRADAVSATDVDRLRSHAAR